MSLRGGRIVDVWVNRRPDDVFIDQLTARLNVDTMTAAERRTAMDGLIRHVVVDPAKPAAGECGWCPTRRQLATVPDGKRRLPQFSRLMASPAGRRAVGEPCERCTRTALGVVKQRVHAGRAKSPGSTTVRDGGFRPSASRDRAVVLSDPRTKLHDPFRTCQTCAEFRNTHPEVALTAGGIPVGCAPHAWNEKPHQRWSW